jgi:hypothetical protein
MLDSQTHPHEKKYLRLDSTKTNILLDWRVKWPLIDSIRMVANRHLA